MALTTRLALDLFAELTSALDLGTGTFPLKVARTFNLGSGTGAGQADVMWSDRRTIAASGTDSLDLAGSLTNAFGAAFTPAKVKAVIVAADSGNTNNVVVTRPASNGVPVFSAAGDAVPVRPGGLFTWVATDATAVAVTAGTGDLLDLVNSAGGTSVTYDIVIIGTSA